MTTLVPIDGSQSSLEAARYAVRTRPDGEVILLYVAPSARHGDLERGRFLLQDFLRQCRILADHIRVETRLEVGNLKVRLPEVAEDSGCDRVVMGAFGLNSLPHVETVGLSVDELTEEVKRPLVLVLPTGETLGRAA